VLGRPPASRAGKALLTRRANLRNDAVGI
jgi:hypothetical protein